MPQGEGYGWHYLTGHWGAEWQLHSEPLQTGARVIESRRGSTSHQANPWFAIDRPQQTTEESGPVWFGALGWSGSWRITVEQTAMQQVRVTGGFNPFDFGYRLKPGEQLETPPFYGGFTNGGMGEASRILHRFERQSILPGGEKAPLRPVLYNSWEATEFNVSEAGQIALAEKASKLGMERFVIDDGWFGQRKDDHAGLGDWYVNTAEVSPRTEAGDRSRARAGHGLRHLGGAGDGEPRQRPLSQASRMGDEFSRASAHRGAQPTAAEPGPG